MSGKDPRLTPLQSRKQLLIAESEIIRVQLLQDWQKMADGLTSLGDRAKSFNTTASTIVSLVVGLATFTGRKSAPTSAKTSWFQKVLTGVRVASTIWLLFRTPNPRSEKE